MQFLYYLFDRHWTKPDAEWRHLVDDFASSFGISRHLVLESLTFYLLDDHSDQAVQVVLSCIIAYFILLVSGKKIWFLSSCSGIN